MKVYILKVSQKSVGTNADYTIEHRVFSSKRKARKSLESIIEYYASKLVLSNVPNEPFMSGNEWECWVLGEYLFKLTEEPVMKRAINYVIESV